MAAGDVMTGGVMPWGPGLAEVVAGAGLAVGFVFWALWFGVMRRHRRAVLVGYAALLTAAVAWLFMGTESTPVAAWLAGTLTQRGQLLCDWYPAARRHRAARRRYAAMVARRAARV